MYSMYLQYNECECFGCKHVKYNVRECIGCKYVRYYVWDACMYDLMYGM